MTLEQLKALRATKIVAMQTLLDGATATGTDLSAEQTTQYEGLMTEQISLKSQIERIEEQNTLNAEMATPVSTPLHAVTIISGDDNQLKDETGFENFGEYLGVVRSGSDSRLDFVAQSMGTDSEGGFLIPKQFGGMLTAFKPGESIVRPRATVIPSGSFADGEISFPALDQSGAKGVYSGVTTSWVGEGAEISETNFSLREITLKSNALAAFVPFTNKLLRNAPAASMLGVMLLRQAIAKAEDDAFLNGNGTAKPLGFIGHAATKTINRGVASTVKYSDLVSMVAAVKMGGSLEWTINQTVIPQLMNMVDAVGNMIWQPNAVAGMGTTLLGFPVKFVDRTPVLGAKGDVMLTDLSYYYIKNGSGLIISMSEHVKFTADKTLIKVVTNVDGKSSINSALTLEDGSTTVSPFVVLDVPSP